MKHHTIIRLVLLAALCLTVATPAVAAPSAKDVAAADPVMPDPAPSTPNPAPVLVISSYETSRERLTVGQAFKLTLDVSNETPRSARNVVVSLNSSGAGGGGAAEGAVGGITVLGTGNAKFMGTLSGDRTESVSFRVVAGPGTSAGALTIPVTISFEYGGERQESAYTIGLVFERDAVLTLATAEIPKTARAGEPIEASFELVNAGSFTLPGLALSVEASSAAIEDGSLFVGAFEAGAAETIDVRITPEKAGPLEVALVAKYRDDFGREQVFRSVHVVEVEGEPKPAPGENGSEEPAAKGNWFTRFFRSLFGLGS